MRILLAPAMLIAASSCATARTPNLDSGSCEAGNAQSLIGQPASSEVAAKAKRLSHAALVRWLQPGQIVTMEYRSGRLNIVLDAENKVQAIRCG